MQEGRTHFEGRQRAPVQQFGGRVVDSGQLVGVALDDDEEDQGFEFDEVGQLKI